MLRVGATGVVIPRMTTPVIEAADLEALTGQVIDFMEAS